ncbi:MAG: glycosyltransferase family 2 protein [Bacteroidota bacterium]
MVSVILINYNTFGLTSACLRSIYAHTKGVSVEVILVDNASTECDPTDFLLEFPTIKLIRSEQNLGFAGGNNLGLQEAQGEYVLLLNSDTELTEDSISLACQEYNQQSNIGFLGCRMVYPDVQVQYTARRFRSIRWELLDLFRFIPLVHGYKAYSREMLGKYFRHDVSTDCDWLNGAFLFFERRLVIHFPEGKLDDRFFMYAEDQLWCEQAREAGCRNYFYAGTTVVHVNSGSSSVRRQLQNRQVMFRHELDIVRRRKGTGFYYVLFVMIFGFKEYSRNAIKWIVYQLTGRLLR